jgi:putative heme-binding domain-containing protein
MANLILSVIGSDRPGLTQALAAAVLSAGGNWLESRMARLAGQFAGILRVECAEADADKIIAELKSFEAEGLSVIAVREKATDSPALRTLTIDVVGNDRPGIVKQLAAAIAGAGGNVEELVTGLESAAMSGQPLFRAHGEISLPEGANGAALVAAIEKLVTSSDDSCAARAIEATAAWQVTAATEELAGIADSTNRSPAVRKAAIAALGGLPGDLPREALLKLCAVPGRDELDLAALIAALVPRSPTDAATQAVTFLGTARNAAARTLVFQAFLSAQEGATKLAGALDAWTTSLSQEAAHDGQQAVSASGRQEPGLSQAIAAASARASGGIPLASASPHAMSAAELDAFVELVRGKADATRGAAIYARENLKCVTCHRIDTAGGRVDKTGGRVGPNLTAIGASSPLDYIIDSLVYPAKNVKEGYNTVVVQTDGGQVITGIQVARSDDELILRSATGAEVKIPTADIDEESAGTSLMPAGLIDSLSREELADLVRYLSELGR